jgi:hypothetical protein
VIFAIESQQSRRAPRGTDFRLCSGDRSHKFNAAKGDFYTRDERNRAFPQSARLFTPPSNVLTPLFSHCCELFCASQKVKSFPIYNIHTLCRKTPGVGAPPQSASSFQALPHSSNFASPLPREKQFVRGVTKSCICHTSEISLCKFITCHTSKNTRLKVLCLPHIQKMAGVGGSFCSGLSLHRYFVASLLRRFIASFCCRIHPWCLCGYPPTAGYRGDDGSSRRTRSGASGWRRRPWPRGWLRRWPRSSRPCSTGPAL